MNRKGLVEWLARGRKQLPRWLTPLLNVGLVIGVFYFLKSYHTPPKPPSVPYNEFMAELRAGHFVEVSIAEEELIGKLKEDASQARGGKRELRTVRASPFTTGERNYSEQVAEEIDQEVRRIIDESYDRVRAILSGRRDELERLAEALIRRETLDRAELGRLLAYRSPKPRNN